MSSTVHFALDSVSPALKQKWALDLERGIQFNQSSWILCHRGVNIDLRCFQHALVGQHIVHIGPLTALSLVGLHKVIMERLGLKSYIAHISGGAGGAGGNKNKRGEATPDKRLHTINSASKAKDIIDEIAVDYINGAYVIVVHDEWTDCCVPELSVEAIIQLRTGCSKRAIDVVADRERYIVMPQAKKIKHMADTIKAIYRPWDTDDAKVVDAAKMSMHQAVIELCGSADEALKLVWGHRWLHPNGNAVAFDEEFNLRRVAGAHMLPDLPLGLQRLKLDSSDLQTMQGLFGIVFRQKALWNTKKCIGSEERHLEFRDKLFKEWLKPGVYERWAENGHKIEYMAPLVSVNGPVRLRADCDGDIDFGFRKPEIIKYGCDVDGFTLEASIPSEWHRGQPREFIQANLGVIKKLAIKECLQTKYMREHDGLDQMLFVSSIDVTASGFMTVTVAIKGGNISHRARK